jgi:hypothetical protein
MREKTENVIAGRLVKDKLTIEYFRSLIPKASILSKSLISHISHIYIPHYPANASCEMINHSLTRGLPSAPENVFALNPGRH